MNAGPVASGWSAEELRRLGDRVELQLASRRADGTLRPYVTMWVARAGEQLYVRSAYGPDNPWYRRARAAGTGRIRAGGLEKDVTFVDVDSSDARVHEALDAAYSAKYDHYGPQIVGTVVGPAAHQVTVRLDPQPSDTSTGK